MIKKQTNTTPIIMPTFDLDGELVGGGLLVARVPIVIMRGVSKIFCKVSGSGYFRVPANFQIPYRKSWKHHA
jgi:hypothetical protein